MKHLTNVTCSRFVRPGCKKPHPTASRTGLHTHPPTHHGRSRAIPSHTTTLPPPPPPPHCLPLPTAAPRPAVQSQCGTKGLFYSNKYKRTALYKYTKAPRASYKGAARLVKRAGGGCGRRLGSPRAPVPLLCPCWGAQRAPRCGRLSSRSPRSRPAALSTPRSHSVHLRTSPSSSAAAPSSSSSYSSSS